MIPIFEPNLDGLENDYVERCMKSGWISSQGSFITDFEKKLSRFHGLSDAIVTSSCTTALHLALKSLNIGPGDEVICPDLTFIAPANMIVLSGASLRLVDVDAETLALDPDLVRQSVTDKTKAIIIVHQFGHAAPMDELMSIAHEFNLKVIEDNAESIGGKYKGKLLGTFGDLTCLSFFANKIMTTGEGGAVLTNDETLAERCRVLRDHGMSKEIRYKHIDLGYNYRMTNLQAAIGLAQIERLPETLKKRRKQMDFYYELIDEIEGVSVRPFSNWCEPVHWLTTIELDPCFSRDEILAKLKNRGIDCRQMINPVHHAMHFKKFWMDQSFPVSIMKSKNSLHLPSSSNLTLPNIEFIVNELKNILSKYL